jgi:hypothetical protein
MFSSSSRRENVRAALNCTSDRVSDDVDGVAGREELVGAGDGEELQAGTPAQTQAARSTKRAYLGTVSSAFNEMGRVNLAGPARARQIRHSVPTAQLAIVAAWSSRCRSCLPVG